MEPNTTQQITSSLPASGPRATKIAVLIVIVMVILGSIVGGVVLTQREADNQASVAVAPSAQVQIGTGGSLLPQTIQIRKGQAVTWTNADSSAHRIALLEGAGGQIAEGLGSGLLEEGNTYTYTFEKTGTYTYYDALSSGHQAGVVVVKE